MEMEIEIDKIKPDSEQPRKTFDQESISRLADTIKMRGLIYPIEVDENYQIIIGERRWHVYKLLNFKKIPVIIKKGLSKEQKLERRLIENLSREELPLLEKAEAIKKLKELKHLSNFELSKVLGISERHVYRLFKLLDLPEEMKNALKMELITFTELMEITKLPENQWLQALKEKIEGYEKPKIRYKPKDFLRRKGANPTTVLPTNKSENLKHFIVKCILYKLFRDEGKNPQCEVEIEGAVADVVCDRYAFEIESNPTPKKRNKKLKDFESFEDVFIINLGDVPNDVGEMVEYLKKNYLMVVK